MAVCGVCGSEIPAGTVFCPNCGTPAGKAKKGVNKKLIGIIGAAVAVVVVVILLIKVFGGSSNSPSGMFSDMEKTLNKRSASEKAFDALMLNTYDSAVEKEVTKALIESGVYDDYDSFSEMLKEEFEEMYDKFDDEYGDDWKVTIEVKKEKDLKKSSDEFERCEDKWDSYVERLEKYAERYEDMDDYEEAAEIYEKYAEKYEDYKVTEVKEVKVKVSIKGEDDKDSSEKTILFAKVNGKWICFEFNMLGL